MNMLLMRQENYEACMSVHAAIALIAVVMCWSRQRKISDGHAQQCSSNMLQLGADRRAERVQCRQGEQEEGTT